MQLTPRQQLILQGKICPYCGRDTEYVDSAAIYGRSYGMVYLCRECKAYVGVHKGTNKALGRLANAELREWKIKAHGYFDPLWKQGVMGRKDAYKWMSEQLNIPPEYTHIGYFSVETCKQIVSILTDIYKELYERTESDFNP